MRIKSQSIGTLETLRPQPKVKRLDPRAKLPTRGTARSAGLDLYALETHELSSFVVTKVRTGIAIAVPPGYEAQVRGRSGLTSRGIFVELGTIDSDYRGEVSVMMWATERNTSGYDVYYGPTKVDAGDRIAQLVIAPVWTGDLTEVDELDDTERGAGGFGSTGR